MCWRRAPTDASFPHEEWKIGVLLRLLVHGRVSDVLVGHLLVGVEDTHDGYDTDRRDDRGHVDDEEQTIDAQRHQAPFQTHLLLGVTRLELHHERAKNSLDLVNL